jgi:hypothetical protein
VRNSLSWACSKNQKGCTKAYNDTYGHQSGDACLAAVPGSMKEMAKREMDLVARRFVSRSLQRLPCGEGLQRLRVGRREKKPERGWGGRQHRQR